MANNKLCMYAVQEISLDMSSYNVDIYVTMDVETYVHSHMFSRIFPATSKI